MATFPAAPLDLRAELLIGSAWTDISSYVYQRDGQQPPVVITRGRPDESSTVNASSATLELNNRDGRFSPGNPLSPYYGQLGRNTPLRLSVPAQTPYARFETDNSSYISTPSSTPLNVSGNLELQVDCRVTFSTGSWSIPLLNKWGASGQLSWWLEVHTDGYLHFFLSPDGTNTQFVASTLQLPPGRIAIRVAYLSATGTVTFYTAPTISGTWTQFGAPGQFAAVGAAFASTAPVQIGTATAGQSITGNVYAVKILNNIGGTVVASPDFTSATPGASSVTDAQGNVWTLSGTAEISSRDYRYHGEASSLPGRWDVTGADIAVPVTAGGLLRRLGQRSAPVMSPMKRAVLLQSGTATPVSYWPCEDAAGATSLGSATGGGAMTFDAAPAPNLAADSSFLCSAPLLTLNGTRMHGKVPPTATLSLTSVVRFLGKLGTLPSSGGQILMRLITSGSPSEVRLSAYPGGALGLSGWNAAGNVFDSGPIAFAAGGKPLWYSIEIVPSGGNYTYSIVTFAPGSSTGSTWTAATIALGVVVTDVWVNPDAFFTDTVIGHVSVQQAWAGLGGTLWQALNAWQGEAAGQRYARIATENGYQARIIGAPATSALMGAQPVDTLNNLLQQCEDADRGQAFEPRQALALGYRTLASMLSQSPRVTLDYSLAQPGGVSGGDQAGLDPIYDDQYTLNDSTVTRTSGSVSGATYQFQLNDGSAMSISEPPNGVGDYAGTLSVGVQYDSQLRDIAGWMVHAGTVSEARWPAIPLNLTRAQLASLYYTLLGCDIGDYAKMLNLLAQITHDPVRQLIFQVKESLGGIHHVLEWVCVPESPYEVAVFDDPVYGRADTDGSTLAAGVNSTATSLSVAATDTADPLWTTAAGDFPFDIAVGGERMTVTNITGASSPQTFTVTRSVNGVVKSQSAGADVRLWFPPIFSLI